MKHFEQEEFIMMQTRTKKELKEILKIKKIIATKGYRTHHVINYFIIANFDKIKADLMANRIKPRRWIVTETGIQMLTPLNLSLIHISEPTRH